MTTRKDNFDNNLNKPNNRRVRKRKLPPEEDFGTQDEINGLPEDILLSILRALPVKERCIAGRVCRRWRRIVSDNSLWKHVDLLPYRLNLPMMWKVLRAHFSECLLTIKIRGYLGSGSIKNNKPCVSDAMMKELSSRCPNLHRLQLHNCHMHNLAFESLPMSLTSLAVTDSSWVPGWFRGKQGHLPQLIHLDLSGTVRIDRFDLADVARFSNLKSLSVSMCYRVKGEDIGVVAKNNLCLESLTLNWTEVSGLGIHHIARNLKSLKKLHLCGCSGLLDSDLITIASGLGNLEVLNISQCGSITTQGLKGLGSLRKLSCLEVQDHSLTDSEVASIKGSFAQDVVLSTGRRDPCGVRKLPLHVGNPVE